MEIHRYSGHNCCGRECGNACTFVLCPEICIIIRNLSDFSFYFMLTTILLLVALKDAIGKDHESKPYTILCRITFVLIGITIFINYYSLLANGRYNSFSLNHPNTFYLIKYWFFKL